MDFPVLVLVLAAAAGHAGWNAWLKNRSADLSGFATIALGWLLAGLLGAAVTGLPDAASRPWLLASLVVHTAYAIMLISAYRYADFSMAYPIARGSGPLMVALAAPVLLHETLDATSSVAVLLLVTGIFLIGGWRPATGQGGGRAILLSLGTGMLIATYTLIDASGARAGNTPHAYAAWLFVTTAIPLLYLAWRHYGSDTISRLRPAMATGIAAGIVSVAAYWIVIWAMTMAPAALVAATRETSILFAALLGWLFFGEKITALRWLGIALTLAGVLLARL